MASSTDLFEVGDNIETNFDGVVRTVTAKGSDSHGSYLEYSPPHDEVLEHGGVVANWKTKTDFSLDLRVQAGSPAIGGGQGGGDIGCDLNMQEFRQGDFNGDGQRDVPVWPPE